MGGSPHESRIASHIPTVATLPAGEYLMGCDRGRADEQPVHRVRVDAFAMGITTVTNEQYRFFVSRTGGRMPDSFLEPQFSHPRQPVVSVSWQQAAAYCHWLSDWTHENYRLPTEAEWEWAVRQNKEGCLYAWGDEDPSEFELYRTGWRDRCPRPVGLQPPNDFGLHDLGENVPGHATTTSDPPKTIRVVPGPGMHAWTPPLSTPITASERKGAPLRVRKNKFWFSTWVRWCSSIGAGRCRL